MPADPRNPLLVREGREARLAREQRTPTRAEVVDARLAKASDQGLVAAIVGHAGDHEIVAAAGGDALSQSLLTGQKYIEFDILPQEPAKLAQVRKALAKLKPQRLEEEPIGFGLSALIFTTLIPDAGGVQDELEDKIRAIEGVGEFEVLRASRSL